jgi:hypothetical protein
MDYETLTFLVLLVSTVVVWIDGEEGESRKVGPSIALYPPLYPLFHPVLSYSPVETKEPITVQEMDHKSFLENVFQASVIDYWKRLL